SDTDGKIYFRIHHNGSTRRINVSNLPHDERERNKTDHYVLDVYGYNIDEADSMTFSFETTSTDGWLPASVYIIGYSVDGQCMLLAGDVTWPDDKWLDKPSHVTKSIPRTDLSTAVSNISKFIILPTTSTQSGAQSDGRIYLEAKQENTKKKYRLDGPNDDFERGRTEEYVLSVSSAGFSSDDDLELELQTDHSDGWLPLHVFALCLHTDGTLKLLQAVPNWPKSDYIDHPGTPERDLISRYSDTDWRNATAIDPNKYYNVKTIFDNLYMGIRSSRYYPELTELRRDEANGGCQWRFTAVGGGKYQLRDRISGKILDGRGLSNDRLKALYGGPTNSSTHFIPERQSNGMYKFIYANDRRYGIELQSGSKENGGLILGRSPDLFDLIPVTKYLNPEGIALDTQLVDSPASNFMLNVAVGLTATAIDSKVPGGGVVFSEVFNEIFGDDGPDLNDIFDKFRKQLLAEINVMMADSSRREAVNVLESIKTDYLVSYMGEKRSHILREDDLYELANRAHDIGTDTINEMARLLPTFDADRDIIINDANIALMRAALPIYCLAAFQALNAFQEAALVTAVHPNLDLSHRYQTLATRESEILGNIRKMLP
ncbi:MAG: RICIN domain-containing protein, partial [Bacteroidota bacterium]